MERFLSLRILLAFTVSSSLACAQNAPPPPAPAVPALIPRTQAPAGTLSIGTQLVVVDVSVTDSKGQTIKDLKATDFVLTENKHPETIKTFDEHQGNAADAAKQMPAFKLPPGIFTDYTLVPKNTPLSVLLLDTLNTPMVDQSYVRYQLQEYLKHADPNVRIAIFGLSSRLYLLQGFTSDPAVLKNIVDHKLLPRASNLLDDQLGTGNTEESIADTMADIGATNSAVSSMQQFEADFASYQTQIRTQYTLDAFNGLARYLETFPGRKNLIWFSGSFPLTIFADPSLEDPSAVQASADDEIRETANLLNRARVAVYPVDARGLQTLPTFSAANGGHGYARNPTKIGSEISKFNTANAEEHFTMDEIADDTGGHAYYNNNDLAGAVTKALDSGSNFYTLTYTPADRDWKGEYRTIKVQLNGTASAQHYKLSYRDGYYADDPSNPISSVIAGTSALSAASADQRFDKSAMERGAPAPSEVVFKARVLPATADTEPAIAPGNIADPAKPMKPPFRRYVVDFAALTQTLSLSKQPDGRRKGQVGFMVFAYDTDGHLLNTQGDTVTLNVTPETYAVLLKNGLKFREQISVPAKGESFLRLGVHDLTGDHFGVVEIPTSQVARLPPLAPEPVAATPPTTVPPPAPEHH